MGNFELQWPFSRLPNVQRRMRFRDMSLLTAFESFLLYAVKKMYGGDSLCVVSEGLWILQKLLVILSMS